MLSEKKGENGSRRKLVQGRESRKEKESEEEKPRGELEINILRPYHARRHGSIKTSPHFPGPPSPAGFGLAWCLPAKQNVATTRKLENR
jgi:hypothetical protein